jgi:phosphoribosylformylglycinamidine synthase
MPWASKATDIAHNCGLDVAYRERITEYRLSLNWLFSKSALTESQHDQVAALLHDRMTESVADRAHAEDLFTEPAGALQTIDAIAGRKAALQQANSELGLAPAEDEIGYLVQAFAQLQRQPDRCRVDDVCRPTASTAGTRFSTPISRLMVRSRTKACSHDPQHREAQPAAHGGGVFRQRSVMEGAKIQRFYAKSVPGAI